MNGAILRAEGQPTAATLENLHGTDHRPGPHPLPAPMMRPPARRPQRHPMRVAHHSPE
jgi:hypothetical protein